MTLVTQNFEGTAGQAVPTSSALVQGGATTVAITYDTNRAEGATSAKFGATTATETRFATLPTSESPQQAVFEWMYYVPALPSGAAGSDVRAGGSTTTGSPSMAPAIAPDGSVQFYTHAGAKAGTAAPAGTIQAGHWYRFGVKVKIGAAGSSVLAGYVADPYAASPLFQTGDLTTFDLSTRVINGFSAGVIGGGTQAAMPSGCQVDAMRAETGTLTWVQNGLAVDPNAAAQSTTAAVVTSMKPVLDRMRDTSKAALGLRSVMVRWNGSAWVLPDGAAATTRPALAVFLVGAPATTASPSWAGANDVRMDA